MITFCSLNTQGKNSKERLLIVLPQMVRFGRAQDLFCPEILNGSHVVMVQIRELIQWASAYDKEALYILVSDRVVADTGTVPKVVPDILHSG